MSDAPSKTDPADRPLLADVESQLSALGNDLYEVLAARWELARLEIESDLRSATRLAVIWSLALIAALTALPLLVVALSDALAGLFGLARGVWLLILAAGLLTLAVAGGYCAWCRFRHNFLGMQGTLDELREDALWLKERRDGNGKKSRRVV